MKSIKIVTPLEKASCPVIAGKKPAVVAIDFIKQRGGKDIRRNIDNSNYFYFHRQTIFHMLE